MLRSAEIEYEVPNKSLNHLEDFEETDSILKRLMPVLSSFLGKNFELWAIKMEGLLGSVDLWNLSKKLL